VLATLVVGFLMNQVNSTLNWRQQGMGGVVPSSLMRMGVLFGQTLSTAGRLDDVCDDAATRLPGRWPARVSGVRHGSGFGPPVRRRYRGARVHRGTRAAGQSAQWEGLDLMRFECGKIGEVWISVDVLGLHEQIGAITEHERTFVATPTP
jgi:hypothetical protein